MIRLFRGFATFLFFFLPALASAQTPDYVFKGQPYADSSDVNPVATYINTSWNWSDTSGTTYTATKALDGSASGNSVSITSSVELTGTLSAPSSYARDAEQWVHMYVRNPGSYNVSITNNAHVNVSATPSNGGIARFSGIPWNTEIEARVSPSVNNPDVTETLHHPQ